MDHNKKLDMLKEYMSHVYIPLTSAVEFGFHNTRLYPNLTITTTLWKSQIPSFDEFVEVYGDPKYCYMQKINYRMIDLN